MYRSKLGTLYARYGMYPEAEKQYQAAINSNKYLPAIVNMGNVKFLRNDLKQALAFYQQALAIKPKDARILLNVAQAYHEMEKYDDARKYYFQAKELDPAMAMKYKYIETSEDRGVRGAEVESRAVEWDDQ
jgi:tetratricopeptide (TPR) repeat protein